MTEELNVLFEHIEKIHIATFKNSPYAPKVSIRKNENNISFIFCGQKAFDCSVKKESYLFQIKNDFFDMIKETGVNVPYEIKNIKSQPEFTRLLFLKQDIYLKAFTNCIFSHIEKYVDSNYVPDYTYDCCHRYMECSDAKRCTNPNVIHSKSCTYKNKLEAGIIFFGKNRNI